MNLIKEIIWCATYPRTAASKIKELEKEIERLKEELEKFNGK